MTQRSEYERVRDELANEMRSARAEGRHVALRKTTSNLFRQRHQNGRRRVDVRELRHVTDVDMDCMTARVEGMTTYEAFAAATLRHGARPAVAPELKTITVGGAVSGLGIESSSFRYGLVHETVDQMEVLLGDGSVVVCSRDVEPDLFYCLPNSYGTLGYILCLSMKICPAKRYVRVAHTRYSSAADLVQAVEAAAGEPGPDFLDATVFSAGEMYMTTGTLTDEDRPTSNYRWLHPYYASIRTRNLDHLRVEDYIWRWDTDWFWCSRQFCLQHPLVRFIATPWLLNSATYQRVMRLSNRLMPASSGTESVIQDVAIPAVQAVPFLSFLLSEIPITPIWICPFRASPESARYSLYPMKPGLYFNFGFWDVIPAGPEPAYYNCKVEETAASLGGRKALYSSSFYSAGNFHSLYDHERYDAVKKRCDPAGILGDLYAKCVRGL